MAYTPHKVIETHRRMQVFKYAVIRKHATIRTLLAYAICVLAFKLTYIPGVLRRGIRLDATGTPESPGQDITCHPTSLHRDRQKAALPLRLGPTYKHSWKHWEKMLSTSKM